MTELNIVPECYVDTKIAEIVGYAKRKYNHQHGCGDVSNEMQHNRLKEQIALGIIDEDKYKGPTPKYFSEFNLVIQENNLILKRHHSRKHYLILICPEVESWLLEDAKKSGIIPSDVEYNLPDQLKRFVQISKIKDIDRNEGFKKFIKALIKAQAPSVITLQKWINLFKLDQLDTLVNK
jgi:hypothetical protein